MTLNTTYKNKYYCIILCQRQNNKRASCGEEGISGDINICDKCKMVKYAIAEGIDSVTKECTSCDQNVNNITKDL